jgi:hypothetical protein
MGTIFDREHEPPEPDAGDLAYRTVYAAVSLVPGGGPLLDHLVGPPLGRRLDEWRRDLADAVRRLEARPDLRLEDLGKKPEFVDAVLAATQAALRTSQTKKREALKNAVLNAALPSQLDLTVQQIFLGLTDRFTDRHIGLLRLFQDASRWRRPDGSSLPIRSNATAVLYDALPAAQREPDLYELLWSDLYAAGLVKLPKLENGLEGDARTIRRTTPLGDAYLAFITAPALPDA